MIVALMRAGFGFATQANEQKVTYEPIDLGKVKDQNLLEGRVWPLRNQTATPACTAYAAMACVELWKAEKDQPIPNKDQPIPNKDQPIQRVSVGAAYYYMKKEAAADKTEPVLADSPGYTRFKDAVSFLKKTGYYGVEKWNDRLTEQKPAEVDEKDATPIQEVCYHSFPLPEKDISFPPSRRPAVSIARAIYRELAEGRRPVGAGFPAYACSGGHGMTNWTSAFENGIVPMPRPGDALDMEAGHAVCIVGFKWVKNNLLRSETGVSLQEAPRHFVDLERGREGFFVFRNSFGEAFACAPTTGWPQGYGLVPAKLVNQCCWEVMFMRREERDDPQGEENQQIK